MTNLEFLKSQKEWALKWLATPADQLPGELTHEKVNQVLEDTEDKLTEYMGITLNKRGEWVGCYVESE